MLPERGHGMICGQHHHLPEITCGCGCARRFTPRTTQDRYATDGCRERGRRAIAKRAWQKRKARKEKK